MIVTICAYFVVFVVDFDMEDGDDVDNATIDCNCGIYGVNTIICKSICTASFERNRRSY
jgi:hypothetical protein